MNIYSDPQLYDAIHHNYKWDIKLIQSFAKRSKGRVLELASGTGRLAQPIINLGMDYTGLELSKPFLNKAEEKYAGNAKFVLGDMRNFDLGSHFNLIFIGFNSLAHLLKNQDLLDALKAIKLHMNSNTIFAIDIFVPDSSFLYRVPKDEIDIMDFIDSSNNQKLTIFESTNYNTLTEINHINWNFIDKYNNSKFNYKFDMRMWFPDTLNRILTDCNYNIQQFYGDYDHNNFNEKSEKQIYLCTDNI